MVNRIATIIDLERREKKFMPTPNIVSTMIAELMERGVKRADLASLLEVKPPMVSQLKAGKGSIRDDKIGRLARLHGRWSEREALALKYLDWLKNEKGITFEELANARSSRDSKKLQAQVA